MAKRQTNTPDEVLKKYRDYLNTLRKDETINGLPLVEETKSLAKTEKFLLAVCLEEVLNRDTALHLEDVGKEKSKTKGFKTLLCAQIELLRKEDKWPLDDFHLSVKKAKTLESKGETEKEDNVASGADSKAVESQVESQQVQTTQMTEEEKDKTTEPETRDDKEEQSFSVAAKESTVPLLQEPLKEPKSVTLTGRGNSFENGGAVQVATIKAWYPRENWGHIWMSKKLGEDRDPQFSVVFDDIEEEELQKEIKKRVQEWPKKKIANNQDFDENKVLISNPRYYSSRLVVQFYPDTSKGPGNWRATKIRRYERSESERFVQKGDIKIAEDLSHKYKTVTTEDIAPKDLDQKIVSSVQEVVQNVAVLQQDAEKMRNKIRESNKEIDDAMASLFRLKQEREAETKAKSTASLPDDLMEKNPSFLALQELTKVQGKEIVELKAWRETERERRNKEGASNLPEQFSELKKSAESYDDRLKALEKIEAERTTVFSREDKQKEKIPFLTSGEKVYFGVVGGLGGLAIVVIIFLLLIR